MDNLAGRTFAAVFLFLVFTGCQPAGKDVGPPVRLAEKVKNTVREALAAVKNPVTLHYYEGGDGETAGRKTWALLEFMAETSVQISVSRYSLDDGPSAAEIRSSLGVSHGPAIRMVGAGQGTFLFFGFPERKELGSFLEGVVIASGVQANLPPQVETVLANLQHEVLIRIFTTPD